MSLDLDALMDAWPVPGPRRLRPASAGVNNLSYFVHTPAGPYFLRVYRNTNDAARVRYEHALLLGLQRAGLSFAVPLPLATRGGDTYAVAVENGEDVIAALFPVIPGEHPARGNAAHATACGEALGELDAALARTEAAPSLPALGTYGDLYRVHPLVPDPLALPGELPLAATEAARLRATLEELLALVPGLHGRLPRQIIHSDLVRTNALVLGGRVSGLLDFEFASPDLRAMDFAVGVWGFSSWAWGTGREWPLIEAFAGGYGRRVTLEASELESLPALLRLRDATSLVFWAGRRRQGLATEDDVAGRATGLLGLDDWLRAHGEELVRRVEGAGR